jgi:hypothetical protein
VSRLLRGWAMERQLSSLCIDTAIALDPSPCNRLSRSRTTTGPPPHLAGLAGDGPSSQPARWLAGGRRDGSHVHSRTLGRGRRPAIPLQRRHNYAAELHRGLLTDDIDRSRSCLHRGLTVQVRAATQPPSVRFGPVDLLRAVRSLVPHVRLPVLLAGPRPSDGAGPFRR